MKNKTPENPKKTWQARRKLNSISKLWVALEKLVQSPFLVLSVLLLKINSHKSKKCQSKQLTAYSCPESITVVRGVFLSKHSARKDTSDGSEANL